MTALLASISTHKTYNDVLILLHHAVSLSSSIGLHSSMCIFFSHLRSCSSMSFILASTLNPHTHYATRTHTHTARQQKEIQCRERHRRSLHCFIHPAHTSTAAEENKTLLTLHLHCAPRSSASHRSCLVSSASLPVASVRVCGACVLCLLSHSRYFFHPSAPASACVECSLRFFSFALFCIFSSFCVLMISYPLSLFLCADTLSSLAHSHSSTLWLFTSLHVQLPRSISIMHGISSTRSASG